MQEFGAYAFGVVALVVIWDNVISPAWAAIRAERAEDRKALSNACNRLEDRIKENTELSRNILAAVQDIPDRMRDESKKEGLKLARDN